MHYQTLIGAHGSQLYIMFKEPRALRKHLCPLAYPLHLLFVVVVYIDKKTSGSLSVFLLCQTTSERVDAAQMLAIRAYRKS